MIAVLISIGVAGNQQVLTSLLICICVSLVASLLDLVPFWMLVAGKSSDCGCIWVLRFFGEANRISWKGIEHVNF